MLANLITLSIIGFVVVGLVGYVVGNIKTHGFIKGVFWSALGTTLLVCLVRFIFFDGGLISLLIALALLIFSYFQEGNFLSIYIALGLSFFLLFAHKDLLHLLIAMGTLLFFIAGLWWGF
ncbi:hypothetical protein [Helicobacter bizzozeronii]|uniref:hypothetical protein n=1 Tax=Helicobacter bizzozeronii TaxID=56877 RepID=UPI001F174CA4|nr:hypothetical protein [Helicobacter bizzozeronii]